MFLWLSLVQRPPQSHPRSLSRLRHTCSCATVPSVSNKPPPTPASAKTIQLPYQFELRHYQTRLWNYLKNGGKRAVWLMHRKGGKDIFAINWIARESMRRVGLYWHIFPTKVQANDVIWSGRTKEITYQGKLCTGREYLSYFPNELVLDKNNTHMRITLRHPDNATEPGSVYQLMGADYVDCYDCQTEVLTNEGWKLFDNLTGHENVMTITKDFEAQWKKPIRYIKHWYDGPMVRIESKRIDLLVTPNHRMFIHTRKGAVKFKEASKLSLQDRIPSKCSWQGTGTATDEECAMLGFFLAEGTAYGSCGGDVKKRRGYEVIFSQNQGEILEEFKDVLRRAGYNFHNKKKVGVCILNKALWEKYRPLGNKYGKFIPEFYKNLPVKKLKIILDWLIKGDGTIRDGVPCYYTVSRRLADDVQEIAVKCGYGATLKQKVTAGGTVGGRKITSTVPLWEVTMQVIRKHYHLNGPRGRYYHQEEYSGYVHCVEVENNTVLTRRNGKICWSGNSLRGPNPIGVVFSEYSQVTEMREAWNIVRPVLAQNGGWAIFIFTPVMKHGETIYRLAERTPGWFAETLTVDDTFEAPAHLVQGWSKEQIKEKFPPVVTKDAINEERQGGMPEEDIKREFYCCMTTASAGTWYAKELNEMGEGPKGRITTVRYIDSLPVMLGWDLGWDDDLAIWFIQLVGSEIHLIDFYAMNHVSFADVAKVLRERPYKQYGKMYFPHDVKITEMGVGKSRIDQMIELGILRWSDYVPVEQHNEVEGVNVVRSLFSRFWIDADKCSEGLEALKQYGMKFDKRNEVYKAKHDKYSHAAAALRTFAVGFKDPVFTKRGYQRTLQTEIPDEPLLT